MADDITPDDVPDDVVIQTALQEQLGGDWDYMGDLASACTARLREYGRVIVRAEDIRALLGPNPGLMPYVEAGRRLLTAIDDKETSTHG